MSASLEEFAKRILEHALKHLGTAKEALEKSDYDTADFLLQIVANDVVTLRSVIHSKLRFSAGKG